MHTRLFEKEYWYKCPKQSCKSSFKDTHTLHTHCRIHDDDLDACSYCPYRYVDPAQYRVHLKMHFKIRDFECVQCDKRFPTKKDLNRHYQIHEGVVYNCLICETYDTHSKKNIEGHLRLKHGDIVGKHFTWNMVKHNVKIKK